MKSNTKLTEINSVNLFMNWLYLKKKKLFITQHNKFIRVY